MRFEVKDRNLLAIVTQEEIDGLDPRGEKRLRTFVHDRELIVSLRYDSAARDPPQADHQRSVFLEETSSRLGIVLGESAYWGAKLSGDYGTFLPDGRQIRFKVEGKKNP